MCAERILVLRALGLGDFLTAVPAYRALRRAFPGARIALAAPQPLAPLVELLGGAIDELIPVRELETLPAEAHGASLGVNLHGRGPHSHRLLLAAGVDGLLAFRHAAVVESAGGPAHEPAEHEVARWCRLLAAFGIAADPTELELPAPPVAAPAHARGVTLLHPGASSESRRWPVERWIEVARGEHAAGRAVAITGGPDEEGRARAIAAAADVPHDYVFAGRTTIGELAALVAAAGRVVSGDTGVAHLATAYRRPSIVLFGPTAPSLWGPPPRPYHRVLWSGRCGDPHAPHVDPGLRAIPAQTVLAELRLLAAAG